MSQVGNLQGVNSYISNSGLTKINSNNNTQQNKSKMSTTTKVVIGTGLAALASVGIYVATKGKGAKSVVGSQNTESVIQTPLNEIKEMTVNAFKEAGNKFNKGKALLADGTAYTGTITQTTKDGKNIVIEYNNGILQKSTKFDGNKSLSSKEYGYDDSGILNSLMVKNRNKNMFKSKQGNVEITRVNDRLNDIITQKIFHTDGKTPKYCMTNKVNSKCSQVSIYDKQGNLVDEIIDCGDKGEIKYRGYNFGSHRDSCVMENIRYSTTGMIESETSNYRHFIYKSYLKNGGVEYESRDILKNFNGTGRDYIVSTDNKGNVLDVYEKQSNNKISEELRNDLLTKMKEEREKALEVYKEGRKLQDKITSIFIEPSKIMEKTFNLGFNNAP